MARQGTPCTRTQPGLCSTSVAALLPAVSVDPLQGILILSVGVDLLAEPVVQQDGKPAQVRDCLQVATELDAMISSMGP